MSVHKRNKAEGYIHGDILITLQFTFLHSYFLVLYEKSPSERKLFLHRMKDFFVKLLFKALHFPETMWSNTDQQTSLSLIS